MTDIVQINTLDEELEWEEWKRDIPFWRHAVAGSAAGIMEHVAMYPLDTVKTRMQAFTGSADAPKIREVIKTLLKESGPSGLIRGWNVIASGCIPAHVALFSVYEAMKERLESKEDGLLASHHAAICGIAATAAHDCILTPMDVVKQRLQLGCYQGAIDCTRSVIRTEGIRALFRSYPTTLLINAPYGAVLVAVNEKVKSYLVPSDMLAKTSKESLLPRFFLSAGIAAACASVLTHPLDVVKTRLQTQDCFCKEPPVTCPRRQAAVPTIRTPKYTDFFTSVKLIHAEEGLRGFYRGLIPRAALSVPGAAMCWGTYESVKTFLARLSSP